MLASLRAELLVLRKSKVAWALVLTTPMLTLITIYLLWFLEYLGDTPALYAQEGTPAQALQGLLPSQFNIQAIEQVAITAPFIVLGAVIAGGDWGRGTIKTVAAGRAGPGPHVRRAGGSHPDRLRPQRATELCGGRRGQRGDPGLRRAADPRRGRPGRVPRPGS